jgi:hypothetical protein
MRLHGTDTIVLELQRRARWIKAVRTPFVDGLHALHLFSLDPGAEDGCLNIEAPRGRGEALTGPEASPKLVKDLLLLVGSP